MSLTYAQSSSLVPPLPLASSTHIPKKEEVTKTFSNLQDVQKVVSLEKPSEDILEQEVHPNASSKNADGSFKKPSRKKKKKNDDRNKGGAEEGAATSAESGFVERNTDHTSTELSRFELENRKVDQELVEEKMETAECYLVLTGSAEKQSSTVLDGSDVAVAAQSNKLDDDNGGLKQKKMGGKYCSDAEGKSSGGEKEKIIGKKKRKKKALADADRDKLNNFEAERSHSAEKELTVEHTPPPLPKTLDDMQASEKAQMQKTTQKEDREVHSVSTSLGLLEISKQNLYAEVLPLTVSRQSSSNNGGKERIETGSDERQDGGQSAISDKADCQTSFVEGEKKSRKDVKPKKKIKHSSADEDNTMKDSLPDKTSEKGKKDVQQKLVGEMSAYVPPKETAADKIDEERERIEQKGKESELPAYLEGEQNGIIEADGEEKVIRGTPLEISVLRGGPESDVFRVPDKEKSKTKEGIGSGSCLLTDEGGRGRVTNTLEQDREKEEKKEEWNSTTHPNKLSSDPELGGTPSKKKKSKEGQSSTLTIPSARNHSDGPEEYNKKKKKNRVKDSGSSRRLNSEDLDEDKGGKRKKKKGKSERRQYSGQSSLQYSTEEVGDKTTAEEGCGSEGKTNEEQNTRIEADATSTRENSNNSEQLEKIKLPDERVDDNGNDGSKLEENHEKSRKEDYILRVL